MLVESTAATICTVFFKKKREEKDKGRSHVGDVLHHISGAQRAYIIQHYSTPVPPIKKIRSVWQHQSALTFFCSVLLDDHACKPPYCLVYNNAAADLSAHARDRLIRLQRLTTPRPTHLPALAADWPVINFSFIVMIIHHPNNQVISTRLSLFSMYCFLSKNNYSGLRCF